WGGKRRGEGGQGGVGMLKGVKKKEGRGRDILPHAKRTPPRRSRFCRRRPRPRTHGLAGIPLRRTADVTEDGRCLCARRAPIPRLPLRPSRSPRDAVGVVAP